MVESLPSKHETVSSNPWEEGREERRREGGRKVGIYDNIHKTGDHYAK
jgi:hypothetical protein